MGNLESKSTFIIPLDINKPLTLAMQAKPHMLTHVTSTEDLTAPEKVGNLVRYLYFYIAGRTFIIALS